MLLPSHHALFHPFLSRSILSPLSHRPHTHSQEPNAILYVSIFYYRTDFQTDFSAVTCNLQPAQYPPSLHLYSAKNPILIYIASSVCFPISPSYHTFVTISFFTYLLNSGFFFLYRLFFLCYSAGGFTSGFSFPFLFLVGLHRSYEHIRSFFSFLSRSYPQFCALFVCTSCSQIEAPNNKLAAMSYKPRVYGERVQRSEYNNYVYDKNSWSRPNKYNR